MLVKFESHLLQSTSFQVSSFAINKLEFHLDELIVAAFEALPPDGESLVD